jgi:hypothetical protein
VVGLISLLEGSGKKYRIVASALSEEAVLGKVDRETLAVDEV